MTAAPVELVYRCTKCGRVYRFKIHNDLMRVNQFVCRCGYYWFDVWFEEFA